jgi:hypothetical protein
MHPGYEVSTNDAVVRCFNNGDGADAVLVATLVEILHASRVLSDDDVMRLVRSIYEPLEAKR